MTSEEHADSPCQPALRRWESAWRYALVIGLGAYFAVSQAPYVVRSWLFIDIAVGTAAAVLLLFRRRWPTTVGVVNNAAVFFSATAMAPALLATVSVSTRRRRREITIVVIAFLAANAIPIDVANWSETYNALPEANLLDIVLGFTGMFMFLAFQVGWGLYIGSRRQLERTLEQRADRLERDQEMRAKLARDAERSQIAREMHDVLAHRISQVSMRAGAIAFRDDLDAQALRSAAAELQASANAALVDLRGVLGVLRDPESGVALDVPQPRFSDIDTLITHAESTGLRIESTINVESTDDAPIDDTIGRTLYRVTQECLTNARKHAPNVTVTVRITGSPATGVSFLSSNPLPITHSAQSVPSSGFGLIGLTERAALVGGILTTHRSAEEFSVSCRLPWRPDSEAMLPNDVQSTHR